MNYLKNTIIATCILLSISSYSQTDLKSTNANDLKQFSGKFNTYNATGQANDPIVFTYNETKKEALGKNEDGSIAYLFFLDMSGPDEPVSIFSQENTQIKIKDGSKDSNEVFKRGKEFVIKDAQMETILVLEKVIVPIKKTITKGK